MAVLSSGDLAREVGVNKETIRFYERKGLLSSSNRSSNGYRQFTEDDVSKLRFIHKAKDLGFSLNEIQELISLEANKQKKCIEVKSIAETKIIDIKIRIKNLKKIQKALENVVSRCNINEPVQKCAILNSLKKDGTKN